MFSCEAKTRFDVSSLVFSSVALVFEIPVYFLVNVVEIQKRVPCYVPGILVFLN